MLYVEFCSCDSDSGSDRKELWSCTPIAYYSPTHYTYVYTSIRCTYVAIPPPISSHHQQEPCCRNSLMTEHTYCFFFVRARTPFYNQKLWLSKATFDPWNVQDGQYLLDAQAAYGVVVVGLWLWWTEKRCKLFISVLFWFGGIFGSTTYWAYQQHQLTDSSQIFVTFADTGPNEQL